MDGWTAGNCPPVNFQKMVGPTARQRGQKISGAEKIHVARPLCPQGGPEMTGALKKSARFSSAHQRGKIIRPLHNSNGVRPHSSAGPSENVGHHVKMPVHPRTSARKDIRAAKYSPGRLGFQL